MPLQKLDKKNESRLQLLTICKSNITDGDSYRINKLYPGMGNKNNAEALYLRNNRPPIYRSSFEKNCEIDRNDDYLSPAYKTYKQWMICWAKLCI